MLQSYITIATDDISSLGCLVLCNSLKQSGTEKKISVLIHSCVYKKLKFLLQKSFDYSFNVADLHASSDDLEDPLHKFKDYDKLQCWLLNQFSKCIFLESNVLVVENIDDLFERPELSAVSNQRWPDFFDTGVFVFEPSYQTYMSFIKFATENKYLEVSIGFFLNSFFSNWGILNIDHKIPFIYNCQLNSSFYTHTTALLHFGRSVKVARLGNSVLEMMQPNTSCDSTYYNWNRLWLKWWQIFNEMVKPGLEVNEVSNFNRIQVDYVKSQTENLENKNHIPAECVDSKNKNIDQRYYQDIHIPDKSNSTVIQQSQVIQNVHLELPVEIFVEDNSQNPEIVTFPDLEKYDFDNEFTTTLNVEDSSQPNEFSDVSETSTDYNIVKDLEENKEEIEDIHRQKWERGEIDYMGKDCFQNILSILNSNINQNEDLDTPNLLSKEE